LKKIKGPSWKLPNGKGSTTSFTAERMVGAGSLLGAPPNIKGGPKFYKNENKTGKIGSTSPKIGKHAVLDVIFRSSKNDGDQGYPSYKETSKFHKKYLQKLRDLLEN